MKKTGRRDRNKPVAAEGAGAGHCPAESWIGWDLGAPSGVLGANPAFYGPGQGRLSGMWGVLMMLWWGTSA